MPMPKALVAIESFAHFTELIQPGGALIVHTGLALKPRVGEGVKTYTYSRDEGDFHAVNIRKGNGEITFDLVTPWETVSDISLGVPVDINIENGIAAMAACRLVDVPLKYFSFTFSVQWFSAMRGSSMPILWQRSAT